MYVTNLKKRRIPNTGDNAPFYRGSRGNITIPTGSSTVYDNGSDVVLTSGRTFRLIAHNRKWIVTNA